MKYEAAFDAFIEESRLYNKQVEAALASSPPDFSTVEAALRTRETLHAADPTQDLERLPVPVEERRIRRGSDEVVVRVFSPPHPDAVYLHFHMGGWVVGSARASDRRNAEIAAECGVAVVSLEYRLAPEWPAPAQMVDAAIAAQWLATESEALFGVDRLILGGESAGATLAVLLLAEMRDHGGGVAHVVGANLSYGVYDLSGTPSQRRSESLKISQDVSALVYPGRTPEELRDPTVSPLFADLRGLPPALFSVGASDGLLDDTLFMAARWEAAGNRTEVDVYPESLHGFDVYPTAMAEAAHQRMDLFIRSVAGRG